MPSGRTKRHVVQLVLLLLLLLLLIPG